MTGLLENLLHPEIDEEWIAPKIDHTPKLTRKEKRKAANERKKHFNMMAEMRNKIIKEQFPEHADHMLIATDTKYSNGVFQVEYITCKCDAIIEITKEIFENEYGTEYTLAS